MLDDFSKLDPISLMRELLSSLRDVNSRLRELSLLYWDKSTPQDMIKKISDRYCLLCETRSKLASSIYSIRGEFLNSIKLDSARKNLENRFEIEELLKF